MKAGGGGCTLESDTSKPDRLCVCGGSRRCRPRCGARSGGLGLFQPDDESQTAQPPRKRMCPEVTGLVLLDPVFPVLASADAPRPSHTVVTEGGPRRSTAALATKPEGGSSSVSSGSGLHFVICVWRGVLHGHQKGRAGP